MIPKTFSSSASTSGAERSMHTSSKSTMSTKSTVTTTFLTPSSASIWLARSRCTTAGGTNLDQDLMLACIAPKASQSRSRPSATSIGFSVDADSPALLESASAQRSSRDDIATMSSTNTRRGCNKAFEKAPTTLLKTNTNSNNNPMAEHVIMRAFTASSLTACSWSMRTAEVTALPSRHLSSKGMQSFSTWATRMFSCSAISSMRSKAFMFNRGVGLQTPWSTYVLPFNWRKSTTNFRAKLPICWQMYFAFDWHGGTTQLNSRRTRKSRNQRHCSGLWSDDAESSSETRTQIRIMPQQTFMDMLSLATLVSAQLPSSCSSSSR